MWNTGETSAIHDVAGDLLINHARPDVSDARSLADDIRRSREEDPLLHVFVDAALGDGHMVSVVGRVRSTTDNGVRIRSRTWAFRVDDRIREIWRY